jgi:urease accessory protein
MLRLTRVLGNAAEPAFAERLHHLEHRGMVETITLPPEDTARRRLRTVTDRGTESAIILSRAERLTNGAVLLMEPGRAVVVRLTRSARLGIEPRDAAAALELGYLAGNMHWKVHFESERLWVTLDGDEGQYRARLSEYLRDGRVRLVEPEDP